MTAPETARQHEAAPAGAGNGPGAGRNARRDARPAAPTAATPGTGPATGPATGPRPAAGGEAVPVLAITVEDAGPREHAATPTLCFTLRLDAGAATVRALVLDAQIRVAAPRRAYDDAAKERLAGLFGAPDQWDRSLRSLPWTRATVLVPPFTGTARVDLPVGCTYDLEDGVVGYFRALRDGDIPLEFLFSGTIFYAGDGGLLRTARLPWDTEADFALPVAVWDRLIGTFYPDTAWVRLRRRTAERLAAYRTRHALTSLEATVEALLEREGGPWTR